MKEDVGMISTNTTIKQNTKSCTYVGLYGSGLFNFGSHLTLFACFLGFDIPTSSFIFIGNVFYSCRYKGTHLLHDNSI